MIPVTKPFLPPKEILFKYLDEVLQRNWLTNNGPLVNQFELKIKEMFSLPHFLFLNNGTIALQIAIKALGLKGEIITTPFSYVATSSSIVWEGCKPIFVDIDENTLNINPDCIEAAITQQTTAILATHVYGNPCNIDKISSLANKFGLKVIYDAAHCFGTYYNGRSIFSYGDVSTISFHATKIFHTVEGGGVFTNDSNLLKKMSYMRNFGHDGPHKFKGVGINGKNSEFHAAMGLSNIPFIEEIFEKRKSQYYHYLEKLKGLDVKLIQVTKNAKFNYAYLPVIFKSEEQLINSEKILNDNRIFPRRYFYPSLNNLDYVVKGNTPVAEDISKRVLCLPIYHELTFEEIDFVARLLLREQNN